MNRLNFNQSVGFPLETEILDEMQKAWGVLNALGALAGNYALISGCETGGGSVTNGVVFIAGEVLEFRGGVTQDHVIIVEEPQLREFEDGNLREVIYTRYATFGTATTQWLWTDFKRGFPTIDIEEALELKEDKTVTDDLVARLEALEERAVPLIKITSAQDVISSRANGNDKGDNYDYNYVDVYPPTGYAIGDLKGFIPSINQIDFAGDVNGDDLLFCKYKLYPVSAPDRVRIICSNSETDTASKVNWMATWIKY